MIKRITLVTGFALLLSGVAFSDGGFSAYRGADGEYSENSQTNLDTMEQLAHENGKIRVWIGFELPFQGNPALRTAEVIATEAAAKSEAMNDIVAPLIHQGKAIRIAMDPEPGAPGCMLVVDKNGLKKLATDQGVRYIGYLPTTELMSQ